MGMRTAMNTALRRNASAQLAISEGLPSGWWRDTPWTTIQAIAMANLPPKAYDEWRNRPDVIARSEQDPQ